MMDALRSAGAESVIAKRYNNLAINMNRLDCDYYRLLDSAPELPREYRGGVHGPVLLGRGGGSGAGCIGSQQILIS